MSRSNFAEVFLIVVILLFLGSWLSYWANGDAEKDLKTKCVQSVGTWRKVIEMYANDNENSSYPTELNWRPALDDDVRFLNDFSRYTDVTKTIRDCAVTLFTSVTTLEYTISAWAKDRNHTLITGTPAWVFIPK